MSKTATVSILLAMFGIFLVYVSLNFRQLQWINSSARKILDNKAGQAMYLFLGVGLFAGGFLLPTVVFEKEHDAPGFVRTAGVDLNDFSRFEPLLHEILLETDRYYPGLRNIISTDKQFTERSAAELGGRALLFVKLLAKNSNASALSDVSPEFKARINGLLILKQQGRVTSDQAVLMGTFYGACLTVAERG